MPIIGGTMLMLLTLVLAGTAAETAGEDAKTLIQRVIDAQERQHRAQREYAYRERTVTRHLDNHGEVSKTESETYVITPTVGGEYRRLVARNGTPLSEKDAAKEEDKLAEHIEQHRRLSAAERARKTRKELEDRIERYQKRLEEALEVYDFEPLPDDVVDGERVRVFRFTPKQGYEGHSRFTNIFARMEGTVWIDARRDQLAKVSVAFTEDLKFLGGVFGRISKGTRATVDGELRDGLWMLESADVSLNARLYFLKRYRQHITVDYDDYEKYRVDTHEKLTPVPASSGRGNEN